MQAKTRAVRLLEGIGVAIDRLNEQKNAPNVDAFEVYRDSENYRKELENVFQEIERQLRKPRGRPRVQLDQVQQDALEGVIKRLRGSISELGVLARDAQRRTQKPKRQPSQPPPQVGFLNNALSATLQMAEKTADSRFCEAAKLLKPLVNSRSVPRAIGILDELKASGMELGGEVESARRELRASIGWAPLAPVSLEEALGQVGVSLEGEGEERLVRAIDGGLVVGLGGRGEAFETVLRAIAEGVAEEMGN